MTTSTGRTAIRRLGRIASLLLLPLAMAACGEDASQSQSDSVVGDDPQLAAGRSTFQVCSSCHVLYEERHRAGPHLVDVFGREAGGARGFRYSAALAESGIVWNEETLDQYLANPRGFIPGNRMSFAGLRDPQERADLIAYLRAASAD